MEMIGLNFGGIVAVDSFLAIPPQFRVGRLQ